MTRQKVSAACENCRRRKVKCDAREPICGPCLMRNEPSCVYKREGDGRRNRSRITPRPRSSTALVTQVSEPIQRHGNDSPSSISQSASDSQSVITSITRNSVTFCQTPPCSAYTSAYTSVSTHPIRALSGRSTVSTADADAMTGIVSDSSTSIEFFGSSSAVSFMRQINSAIDARLGIPQPTHATTDRSESFQKKQGNSEQYGPSLNMAAYVLPPRKFADSLLRDYYDLVWVILPTHDWTVFRVAYDAVWLGNETTIPDRELYSMINVAFALGSQFSHGIEPTHRRETGQTFWTRAQTLFNPFLHYEASLERVQCLLMMGLFLQSTCQSHQCWMTIGSAIRMAQSLGLHLSSSSKPDVTFRETEIARRVWHGCVFMDRCVPLPHIYRDPFVDTRVLSMTFGRPSMIADWLSDAVPLPLMIDDDYLDSPIQSSPVRPDGKTTEVAFFIKSLELYSIVNRSLLELYMMPRDKASSHQRTLASVLECESSLTRWALSIPEQLRYSPEKNDEDFIFQRQRIVLRARYLHARMLILRPVISEVCLKQSNSATHRSDAPMDHDLSQMMANQCSSLCFDAAHDIINMIHANLNLQSVTGPVPAWWFGVLFLYTAATVLLAERFRPLHPESPAPSLEPWPIGAEWDKAIEILKAYAQVGESADRCVAALEILSAKIQGEAACQQGHREAVSSTEKQDTIRGTSTEQMENSDGSHISFNLGHMDFDIHDMLWLNSSAADILF